jgi:hypothetical protein
MSDKQLGKVRAPGGVGGLVHAGGDEGGQVLSSQVLSNRTTAHMG